MTVAESFLVEFETQAPITRRFLERLPEDKLMWKPHERSLTAGQLALHIAMTPANVLRLTENNPVQSRKSFDFPQPTSRAEILKALNECMAAVRAKLPAFDDAAMTETWRLEADGRVLIAVPRAGFLRDVMFSHWYQHRGQFSVYLRLLDVAVPASWGPCADEPPLFVQQKAQAAKNCCLLSAFSSQLALLRLNRQLLQCAERLRRLKRLKNGSNAGGKSRRSYVSSMFGDNGGAGCRKHGRKRRARRANCEMVAPQQVKLRRRSNHSAGHARG